VSRNWKWPIIKKQNSFRRAEPPLPEWDEGVGGVLGQEGAVGEASPGESYRAWGIKDAREDPGLSGLGRGG